MSGPRRFPFPFPGGWFQVAYSDEIPSGTLRSLRYFGLELVALRGADGQAHVLDAHCPHLGAHLGHGGRVVGNTVRCPFHAWEFDGRGRCTRVPYAKRVPAQAKLRAWPVVERNGAILVHYDKDGAPPTWQIPEVAELHSETWSAPIRRDFVVRSQPQELAENTVDPAHFKYVHHTAELPKARAWTEEYKLRVKMSYPISAGETVQHGEIDITTYGFGFGVTRFTGIVDTTVIVSGTAIDAEHVANRLSFMIKKRDSEEATRELGEAFVAEITRQFEEDCPIWENKVYWDRPILCDSDGPIALLRTWAQQFY